jgi:hypothetical protein
MNVWPPSVERVQPLKLRVLRLPLNRVSEKLPESLKPMMALVPHHAALVSTGERLLLLGGYTGSGFGQPSDGVWQFDPASGGMLPELDRLSGHASEVGMDAFAKQVLRGIIIVAAVGFYAVRSQRIAA